MFVHNVDCLKISHSRPLFLYFCLFNAVDSKQMFNINFPNDWLQFRLFVF